MVFYFLIKRITSEIFFQNKNLIIKKQQQYTAHIYIYIYTRKSRHATDTQFSNLIANGFANN